MRVSNNPVKTVNINIFFNKGGGKTVNYFFLYLRCLNIQETICCFAVRNAGQRGGAADGTDTPEFFVSDAAEIGRAHV